MTNPSRTFAFITLVGIPLAAGIVYGSWAAYANIEYGSSTMLSAGLGQGLYAVFSTWIVTAVASRALRTVGPNPFGMTAAFFASFFVMLLIPISVHSWLGTPDMWQAIAPGLIWGSLYIAAFIVRTRKALLAPERVVS